MPLYRFGQITTIFILAVTALAAGITTATNADSKNFSVKNPKSFFHDVGNFSEGFAPVREDTGSGIRWGFINTNGEKIISPQFDDARNFSEGLAAVLVGNHESGKWGFIDKTGKFVINPEFDFVFDFSDGVAVVGKGKFGIPQKNPKFGVINKKGNLIVDFSFNHIFSFSEGIAAAQKNDKDKYGFIDKNGKMIINPKFDVALPFHGGKAIAGFYNKKNKIAKYGFINQLGEFLINPEFGGGLSPFYEGLAVAEVKNDAGSKVGFINEKGAFVISPQFDNAGNFSEGLAAVQIGNGETGKCGFIDRNGKFVINPVFNCTFGLEFKEGFARVSVGEKNKKWGFVDKNGDFLVRPQFEYAGDFHENFALVAINDDVSKKWKYGFIEKIPADLKNIKLDVSASEADTSGITLISIKTNGDISSLKINGEEHGGSKNGLYSIRKVARAGQETTFAITATDINGNTETKTITVNRPIAESPPKFAALNPSQIKKQPEGDAVAIVIGIADYKNLPRADFANDDASMFYDYAIRGLGIKPENIKLLVDANADDVAIYQAFKTWLPSRVRSTTDVYIYYSGHGLPAEGGQGLYLLPQRAHRDFIEKTAISQQEINGFIQAAKPKSVTIFLDSCFSGLARTGETLLAGARPVALKTDKKIFPDEFTVITASQADQISSSSPDLKHGIFSYYLMRGMEGEADANRDGKITVGEMHGYLAEQVTRQAGMLNRRQEPQLVGDANRVLVGR